MVKFNAARIVGCLLLGAVTAWLATDLLSASLAQPCPGEPNCFPWGADGPAAGVWSYASKSNYVLRGIVQLCLTIGAGLFLIWRGGQPRGLTRRERMTSLAALAAAVMLMFV